MSINHKKNQTTHERKYAPPHPTRTHRHTDTQTHRHTHTWVRAHHASTYLPAHQRTYAPSSIATGRKFHGCGQVSHCTLVTTGSTSGNAHPCHAAMVYVAALLRRPTQRSLVYFRTVAAVAKFALAHGWPIGHIGTERCKPRLSDSLRCHTQCTAIAL